MTYKELVAEIQIRTVLQHAWAAISHALQYKHEEDIPRQFRRKLTRVSGLLELADEQFAQLREAQVALKQNISERVSQGDLHIPIDSVSLDEFIKTSTTIRDFYTLAVDLGFEPSSEHEDPDFDFVGAGLSQLTRACNMIGIQSVDALEQDLRSHAGNLSHFFQSFLSQRNAEERVIAGDKAHVAAMTLIAAHHSQFDVEQVASQLQWSRDYAEDVLRAGTEQFG